MRTRSKKNSRTPPLSIAGTALSELMTFVEVSAAGLKNAAEARQVLYWTRMAKKVLGESDPLSTEEHLHQANERAQKLEAFAKGELKYGLPYLYGIASTRLWSILEAMVDDLLVYLLQFRPECRGAEIIRKLEGPLVEFATAKESDKAKYLADLLIEQVKARLKLGIGRFESTLKEIGMGGPVDSNVQKTIFELSQIRHVIIHRLGEADEKLINNCPWLNLRPGQKVRVTQKDFNRYYLAFFWYMLELDRRLTALLSETRSEYKIKIHQECLSELKAACSTANASNLPKISQRKDKNNVRGGRASISRKKLSATEK